LIASPLVFPVDAINNPRKGISRRFTFLPLPPFCIAPDKPSNVLFVLYISKTTPLDLSSIPLAPPSALFLASTSFIRVIYVTSAGFSSSFSPFLHSCHSYNLHLVKISKSPFLCRSSSQEHSLNPAPFLAVFFLSSFKEPGSPLYPFA